jgi:hypothetical protein
MNERHERTRYLFEKILEYIEKSIERGEEIYHFIIKDLVALGNQMLKFEKDPEEATNIATRIYETLVNIEKLAPPVFEAKEDRDVL